TLLRPRPDFYEASDAAPEDVFLVLEVSDTTVWYDKNVKAPLYASAGISEYWLLDLHKEILIVHAEPSEGEYRSVRTLLRGHALRPERLPGITFLIDEMIG